jgi:hypothetical protein
MPPELAIGGILVPGLLLIFLGTAALHWLVDNLLGRFDLYRHVWHPALVRFCLFVCLFGLAALALLR